MTRVPMREVQGIVLRSYEKLPAAHLVLLEVGNVEAAKRWLAQLPLTPADVEPEAQALNVAFSAAGLSAFGLDDATLGEFSREFVEGMDTDRRRRVLGDLDSNSPEEWEWGQRSMAPRMHILLMLYAATEAALQTLTGAQEQAFRAAGLTSLDAFDSSQLTGRKEHFGFRDGIAQPFIAGLDKPEASFEREDETRGNTLPPGEFLLGHPNAYGSVSPSPSIARGGTRFDFGRHGSYLVFRQMRQNVARFWQYQLASAASGQAPSNPVLLASKMVGRWPGGAPLALSAGQDDPKQLDADAFGYTDDPLGQHTPIGSHTRRSNPRDSLEPGPDGLDRLSPASSLDVTRRHRILRRSRPYGPPLVASMDPASLMKADDDAQDRGMLFLCFNANIARQFEFIQQTWINNPKLGGQYEDTDPLMGRRRNDQPTDTFTVPAEPVRGRHLNMQEFITVVGGGYFFMPGIEAVKELAGVVAKLEPVVKLPTILVAKETIPPDEDRFTQQLIIMLRDKVARDYPTGTTRRDAHAKAHGLVKAEFIIEFQKKMADLWATPTPVENEGTK